MRERLMFGPPCISVDVEDWPQSSWDHTLPITRRAADNTRRVLDLLARSGVRTTMFVLGKLAESFPEIVREIQKAGHEVACHGYGHVAIFKQTPEVFREDVRRGKDLVEQAIGERVYGYRAPDFSIVASTLWAFEILAHEGFMYDSSICPIKHHRYGIPSWPAEPIRVLLPQNLSIYEFPIATINGLGSNWPVGGGGYHRLLPGPVIRFLTRRALGASPFVFYCHPYEFDPREFQEIPLRLPLKVRLHQGLGRRWFGARFRKFLDEFGGRKISDLLESGEWRSMKMADFVSGVPS